MTREEWEAIPKEMKARSNWVCVKNGSKTPYNALTGRPASCSDTSSWTSAERAWSAVESGKFDGVGYVFDGVGFVAIDIDDGFDADGFITSKAADIIDSLNSYTEVSRSGRGFHIIVYGELPFTGRNNRDGVEIYRTGRYFIMTGRNWFYDSIIRNQAGIDRVVDSYFPEIKRQAHAYNAHRALYSPRFLPTEDGSIHVTPLYDEIHNGCRNDCLMSLTAQLLRAGMQEKDAWNEMVWVNDHKCKPPLPDAELRQIFRSARKYR